MSRVGHQIYGERYTLCEDYGSRIFLYSDRSIQRNFTNFTPVIFSERKLHYGSCNVPAWTNPNPKRVVSALPSITNWLTINQCCAMWRCKRYKYVHILGLGLTRPITWIFNPKVWKYFQTNEMFISSGTDLNGSHKTVPAWDRRWQPRTRWCAAAVRSVGALWLVQIIFNTKANERFCF